MSLEKEMNSVPLLIATTSDISGFVSTTLKQFRDILVRNITFTATFVLIGSLKIWFLQLISRLFQFFACIYRYWSKVAPFKQEFITFQWVQGHIVNTFPYTFVFNRVALP